MKSHEKTRPYHTKPGPFRRPSGDEVFEIGLEQRGILPIDPKIEQFPTPRGFLFKKEVLSNEDPIRILDPK